MGKSKSGTTTPEVQTTDEARLSPTKRATEDPKEVRDEVQMTDERPESSQSKKSDRDDQTLGSSSTSMQRPRESKKMDCVRSYWNSLSFDLKKKFLRISICDLKSHLESLKKTNENDVVMLALRRIVHNKTWDFWFCCVCPKAFLDLEFLLGHIETEHVGNLLPEMQKLLPKYVRQDWIEKIRDCSWKPLDAPAAVKMLTKAEDTNKSVADSLSYDWPLSDDSQRAQLLEKIHKAFHMLISHKYLATSHLNKVIKFSMYKIQELAARAELINQHLDRSPTCICFQGAPQLHKILKFLLELSHACGLSIYADKSTNPMDDLHNSNKIPNDIKEKIVLSEDESCLLLDECLVPAEITPGATESAAMDPFLYWLFSGISWEDQLTLSMRNQKQNKIRGLELVQTLKNESHQLQNLLENKYELTNYEEALQVVEDLCLEKGKKMENFTEYVQQSYGSVLKMRREELIKSEKHVSNTHELDAIANVLQEAEAMIVNQSGSDKNYTTAIEKLKEDLSEELSKMDGMILRSLAELSQLELQLKSISALDCRPTLLLVVKTYLRATLEDLAEEYETKSNAEREALWAELTLGSEKDVKGGSDSAKPMKKKKDKIKNEENRKRRSRKMKATYDLEQNILDSTTPDSSSAVHDKDHDSIPSDLKQLKEEEIDEEEANKKLLQLLEENLELQRQIEDEAKKKRLAEKHRDLKEAAERRKLELEKEEAKLSETEAEQKGLAEKHRDLKERVERRKLELEKEETKLAEVEVEQKRLAGQHRDLKNKVEKYKLELEKEEANLSEIEAEQKRALLKSCETNLEKPDGEVLRN